MDEKEIFGMALGLTGSPWEVVDVTLDLTRTPGRLDIRLDFPPGTRFPRASDGQLCTIYDTEEHSWRHMNFFASSGIFREIFIGLDKGLAHPNERKCLS